MLYYENQIGNTRVAIWHITEDYEQLLGILPDAESISSEAETCFASEKRRLEWTSVRVLLYTMLERQVQISYNEQGAPLLPEYEGLHISISHTGSYVAIALSDKNKVGIDIEQVEHLEAGKESRVERVKSRIMADDEQADTVIGLLLHWSAKESVFKVVGKEVADFQNDMHILPFDELCYEGNLKMNAQDGNTHIILYKVFNDFVLTLTNYEQ